MTRIFSVGHSTHELVELVRLLRSVGVEQVSDARRHPASRRMPWFNQEVLARELLRHGLAYHHLPELGGRRRPAPEGPNGGWRVEGFRGYADHMASRGWEVVHIGPGGGTTPHELTPFAVVDEGQLTYPPHALRSSGRRHRLAQKGSQGGFCVDRRAGAPA